MTNIATLCYLFDKNSILLGAKKYGGAKGKVNGFGGKVENKDKTIKDAIKREFYEETKVFIKYPKLRSLILLHNKKSMTPLYIYFCNHYNGKPQETKEMKVFWVKIDDVPIQKMWPGDRFWFPFIKNNLNTVVELYFSDTSEPYKMIVSFNQKLYENMHERYQ